jgi:hypothetical protein
MTDTSSPGAVPAASPKPSGLAWPDTRGWLALGGIVQVTLALVLLAFVPIPKENHDVFVVIISQVIGAGFLSIVNYFFGSSKGAGDVRAQLGQALDKLPNAQP